MANSSSNAKAVVQRLEDQRYSAVLAGDVDTFEGLCHPELVYTHSGGNTDSLKAYTDKLRTGAVRYHRIDHESEKITIIGNTALVVVRMNADLTVNGTPTTMKNSALAVWVNEEGSWKFVAYQATPQLQV
ncbi:nuclear transport factor 2 family protein [Arthrobacter sp. FW305-BF8]|uniref:nuclear transport factor 2 family protein n=1 Tax=Arthrobacter sp. FW305-BF8 TaxID=2879617 RepID=UPI001F40C456|nr:nuclear transport factor 2 family protein [Arthrobacter sp. FW305-BF8]UKA55243.1 nuclear transport factor 2 family protein [Arthrobacter sp. FW305-BF8]